MVKHTQIVLVCFTILWGWRLKVKGQKALFRKEKVRLSIWQHNVTNGSQTSLFYIQNIEFFSYKNWKLIMDVGNLVF